MARILVIDDDPLVRKTISVSLIRAGHSVTEAPDGRVGARAFRLAPFDLVITDLLMPEQEGLETIGELRALEPGIKILAISGGGRTGIVGFLDLARRLGATETLPKPFDPETLVGLVERLCG